MATPERQFKRRPRRRPGERAAINAFRYAGFQHEWDASRYTAGWLSIERDEERVVQPAVVAALRARGAFAEILDSGSRKLRGRAFGAMRRAGVDPSWAMKGATGAARKGTPDVIGCTPSGIFIAIECKAPALIVNGIVERSAGVASADQLEWLDAAHRKSAIVGVAWGPSDVALIWPVREAVEP